MRDGTKAAFVLVFMAFLSFIGFTTYATLSGDKEGIDIALITSTMLLVLAFISWIRIRPWK
jgi:uncharacterized membrane protein (UPF0136 family)